jgi:double zinc ribbon protein
MGDFPKSVGTSWSERMRLIRFRRKREKFHFWDEFKVIPRWLVFTVIALFCIAQATVQLVNLLMPSGIAPGFAYGPVSRDLAFAGFVAAIAIPVAAILFLVGYVYRDAKRRGMSAGAWTFLVIALMPAYFALGFIVYFIMREPLPFDCPQCGTKVGARFNYCPNCKYNLHPSCPQCKREVLDTDKFCSFCGQSLMEPPAQDMSTALPEVQ